MKNKVNLVLHNILFYIICGGITIIIIGTMFYLFIKTPISNNENKRYDYSSAKKEVIKYLDDNISDLELYSNLVLKDKPKKCVKYNNLSYCYNNSNKKEYVSISIGDQGFLGGQYWGLIYSKNNLLDDKKIEIYDEKKETGYGNNFYIKSKIKDNWYFTYDDYDGKVDITSIS